MTLQNIGTEADHNDSSLCEKDGHTLTVLFKKIIKNIFLKSVHVA